MAFNQGAQALAAMPSTPPDVVLSDFKMPGMDGLALLGRVRAAHPDAVLMLLTGYADKESAIRAINEVGIWQYVEKPWDLGDLLLKIRAGIERRALVARAARQEPDAGGAARRAREGARRLVRAERLAAVGRVASGMAHEIGNQLALVGYAEAIGAIAGATRGRRVRRRDRRRAAPAGGDGRRDQGLRARRRPPAITREPGDVAAAVEEALGDPALRRDVERAPGERRLPGAPARASSTAARSRRWWSTWCATRRRRRRRAARSTCIVDERRRRRGGDPRARSRRGHAARRAGAPRRAVLHHQASAARAWGSASAAASSTSMAARLTFASTPGEGTEVASPCRRSRHAA